MNLAGSLLEYVVFPGLEYTRHLSLHPLTGVEKCSHCVDQIVKLF